MPTVSTVFVNTPSPSPLTLNLTHRARNQYLLSYRLNVGGLCTLKSPCLAVLQVCWVASGKEGAVCTVTEVAPWQAHIGQPLFLAESVEAHCLSDGMLSATKDKCHKHPHPGAPPGGGLWLRTGSW